MTQIKQINTDFKMENTDLIKRKKICENLVKSVSSVCKKKVNN